MSELSLQVNGNAVRREVTPRTHLGDFLRDGLRQTGTNLSCEHGVCGSCTVLVDERPVRSCITFAVACEGRKVTTIEGYDEDVIMRMLRRAFNDHHALQCGFCTPGMLATSRDIVLRLPDADEERVRIELSGNICRCTGYQGITAAVLAVLQQLRDAPNDAVDRLRGTLPQNAPREFPAFPVFEPFAARMPVNVAATAGGAQASAPATGVAAKAEPSGKSGRGTTIEGGFEVRLPADQVWRFMTDLRAVASCLPGAVIESQEEDRVSGRISIKFGPMAAAFKGNATLQREDSARRATLRGEGVDSLSNSRAKGDVSYQVEHVDAAQSRVNVSLVYSLQGPLAQFSRSGLVQDFVKRMIADFGKNVEFRLLNPDADASEIPQSQISPFKLMMSVIWDRIKGWFGSRK